MLFAIKIESNYNYILQVTSMQTFLDQIEATFYHITTNDKWICIQNTGIISNSGQIFVSRTSELPVLLAIALEQLPEIYSSDEIVVLKLPQSKNNFTINEIIPDKQAAIEWTQSFQNIILRAQIPVENIELMMKLPLKDEHLRTFIISYFTQIASSGQINYQKHDITLRASQIIY